VLAARHHTVMAKAASTSEMSLNFYQTTWHNIPEDSHVHLNINLLYVKLK
jgi:hypothetical protein